MDDLTIPEASDLCLYWGEMPPAHIALGAIARAFGRKPATVESVRRSRVGTDAEAEMMSAQLKGFAAQFGRGGLR